MNATARRRVGLIVQLGLLVLVAGHYLPPLIRSGGHEAAARRELPQAAIDGDLLPVRIGDLDRSASGYEPGRNLFGFQGFENKKKTGGISRTGEVKERGKTKKAKKVESPRIDVELLGIFGSENRRIAVFKDTPAVIINALEDDVVNDKFVVLKVGVDSVEIAFLGQPASHRQLRLRP